MTTTITAVRPSRFLASEIRAECGRQGLSVRELAQRVGVSHTWVARRIGLNAEVDITFEELARMTEALGVSAESLVTMLLPRLDSNQQPSGYQQRITRGGLELVA